MIKNIRLNLNRGFFYIQSKRICLKTNPFVFYFYLPYFAKICASPILS
ncbi:hypothetical protein LEP1GSC166_1342 [Leptospira kirschneri]|nr:hypothetical protein LEP1GSC166_1342 [Leptospira kirschneri]